MAWAIDVFEWMFENEGAFPTERTPLLKRIGWVFAKRAVLGLVRDEDGDEVETDYGFLTETFEKLVEAPGCRVRRAQYEYRQSVMRFCTTMAELKSQPGWHMAAIHALHQHNNVDGGEFVFSYVDKGGVPHSFFMIKHDRNLYTARFKLNDLWIVVIEHQYNTFFFIANDGDEGEFPRGNTYAAWNPTWLFEFVHVTPDTPDFQYVLFDTATKTAAIISTDVENYEVNLRLDSYAQPPVVEAPAGSIVLACARPDPQHMRVVHDGMHGLRETHRFEWIMPGGSHRRHTVICPSQNCALTMDVVMSAYNLVLRHAYMRDPMRRVENTRADKRKARVDEWLTGQLQRRLVRIVRNFLLARAQAAEERRAADPVRKCAACAVEAVKSQLALGIEPALKRVRVSA